MAALDGGPIAMTTISKRQLWLILTLLVGIAVAAAAIASAQPPDRDDLIILFRDGVDAAQRDQILRRAGALPKHHFRNVPATSVRGDARVRAFLERHPDVQAVIPDREVHIQGKPSGGSSGPAAQATPAGVARIGAAPGSLSQTGAGVGVAVVDTGIDRAHPDLAVAAACFTAYASCQDDNGHGTHVAGTIAARNNTIDVVGVAPAATLYGVKVLSGTGSGTDSAVMQGLDWIATSANLVSPPIRVVNMSLGRPGSLNDNPALRRSVQALRDLGISVVVAAGNDPNLEVGEQVPATYPEVFAVASTTAQGGASACRWYPTAVAADTASYFTSDGAFVPDAASGGGIGVTVSAPGEDKEDIAKSCTLQSTGILSTRLGGGTTRMSGTSMAAPHVAGVVALMWERFGAIEPETARARLRLGARLGQAPLDSPSGAYSFDGEREGILSAPGAVQ
jgi:subtilisin